MNQQQPIVHAPAAVWVLMVISALLILWSLLRKPRTAPAKHQHVSFRILWWRRYAPPAAVRRELAPLEIQLDYLRPLAELLADGADAEEGDHAGRR